MRLVTWNAQWCCGLDGAVSPERIVREARALLDFDVLCLQEIAVNYPGLEGGAGHDQPALLQQLLPGFHLFYGPAVDEYGLDGRSRFGNLIATRLPVAQVRHHALPYPADASVQNMPRMCTVVTLHDAALGLVRVMTTHLEAYSKTQRAAQAAALRDLHREYSAQAASPPKPGDPKTPHRAKPHTHNTVLCGDFNFSAADPEYPVLTVPSAEGGLHDAWRLVHGDTPQPPTFRLYDDRYGKTPIACDLVLVSDPLKERVRSFRIDSETKASDHQPVGVEIG